jgi:hypothetical protein
MIAAMEKPPATRTLIAVTAEASRIAFIVVIDPSQLMSSSEPGVHRVPELSPANGRTRCHPGAKRW